MRNLIGFNLRAIVRRVNKFDRQSKRDERTDIGEVWDVLYAIRLHAQQALKDHASATQSAKTEPVMVCSHCGSPEVFFDAWASVNDPSDVRTYDATHCEQCEDECSIITKKEFESKPD